MRLTCLVLAVAICSTSLAPGQDADRQSERSDGTDRTVKQLRHEVQRLSEQVERLEALTVMRGDSVEDTDHIILKGTDVTDELMSHLADVTGLRRVVLYRTKVTDAGLDELKQLPKLKELYIWHSPVSDDAAQLFESFEGLVRLSIIGTKITPECVERLRNVLSATIDYRGGGYLGVRVSNESLQCEITVTSPDSPARRGGLQRGDIIVKIDGRDVRNPEEFFGFMRQYVPGKDIEVTVVRGGNTLHKTITLDHTPLPNRFAPVLAIKPKPMPDIKLNCTVAGTSARGGLVAISVGTDDGVRPDMIFHVGRDGKYLGRLEVLKTRADASVARVLGSRGQIVQGDLINIGTEIGKQ